MRMESVDMTAQNVKKIGALFLDCIIETVNGNGRRRFCLLYLEGVKFSVSMGKFLL